MRRWIGIIALILAVAFLAAVPAIRSAQIKAILEEDRRYEAALYFAHVQAIASSTSQPIDFDFRWETEDVSPFIKGSGPTIVEALPDHSKILCLVGERRETPLRVEVTSEGFQSVFIEIEPDGGGILRQDASSLLKSVSLVPTSSD